MRPQLRLAGGAREAVDLGGGDDEGHLDAGQPAEGVAVVLESRVADVDEQDRPHGRARCGWVGGAASCRAVRGRCGIAAEVALGEAVEDPRALGPAAGVAVAGEVDEQQLAAAPGEDDAVDVEEARGAGGAAGPRDLAAREGVDQGRLADVRPPDEADLGKPRVGERAVGADALDELRGVNLHPPGGTAARTSAVPLIKRDRRQREAAEAAARTPGEGGRAGSAAASRIFRAASPPIVAPSAPPGTGQPRRESTPFCGANLLASASRRRPWRSPIRRPPRPRAARRAARRGRSSAPRPSTRRGAARGRRAPAWGCPRGPSRCPWGG